MTLTPRISTGSISTGEVTSGVVTSDSVTTSIITTGRLVQTTGSSCGNCPENSVCQGGECVCNSGYVDVDGDCVNTESAGVINQFSFLFIFLALLQI